MKRALRAFATWLAALVLPPLLWLVVLNVVERGAANALGVVVQVALGLALGLAARNRVHALALVALAALDGPRLAVAALGAVSGALVARLIRRRPDDLPAPAGRLDALLDVIEAAPRLHSKLLVSCATLAFCAPLVEAIARARLRAIDTAELRTRINSYYDVDPVNPRLWRPRPGFTEALGALATQRSAHRSNGGREKDEGTALIEAIATGRVSSRTALHFNALGFKGEELPREKPEGEKRIVCIGDSCTFGFVNTSYSQVADSVLAAQPGPRVRVVNGGVEGYSALEAAIRAPEYLAIEPDALFVYIGWNGLFQNREEPGYREPAEQMDAFIEDYVTPPSPFRLDALTLFDRARNNMFVRAREALARRGVGGAPRPASSLAPGAATPAAAPQAAPPPSTPSARRWEPCAAPDGEWPRFAPRTFTRLIDRLRAGGLPRRKILIATLPCLLRTDRTPSPRALELAHVPWWAHDNAYLIALEYERYNAFLRAFAAREGHPLVDLDAWARGLAAPPEEVFIDALHLDYDFQVALGEHLAPVLANAVR